MKISSIALFCGSAKGTNPIYAQLARDFGHICAHRQITLLYGGGSTGLMGEASRAAMKSGGTVIGVAPDFFKEGAVLADYITEMIFVKTMSERKQLLEHRADAFVALPGGYGTMDELFEIITDAQLGMHDKPVALFNPNGFYDPLVDQLQRFCDEGFLRPFHHELLTTATTLEDLFTRLENYRNSNDHNWLSKIRH
ncbi:MAG: TIGR00730 family Rossman fold protein [Bacteroidales bacterium]|nr:TIGR00730 family Rossman fold protein [Bacteroidales bacterium]